MPQNSFEQLKMSKKLGGAHSAPQTPSWLTRLAWRASVGDNQFSEFFSLSVDMSVNYTRSTSVNVLSSNLGQVGVRGYVMTRQQT